MKTLFLLFPIFAMSQVGISTTNPTNTLDVNGTARVRSLTLGTVESNTIGVQYTASAIIRSCKVELDYNKVQENKRTIKFLEP